VYSRCCRMTIAGRILAKGLYSEQVKKNPFTG